MRTYLAALLAVLTLSCAATSPTRRHTLAITQVTVIDPASGRASNDMTVLVVADRIARVAPAQSTQLPAGTRVVVGSGKFLIPGLWDSHLHLSMWTELALPLLVANGITAVRDMGGDLEQIDGWRRQVAEGALIGPSIVRPGPLIDGPKPGAIFRLTVRDAADARKAVHTLKADGVDFIKVHNGVPRAAYFALADEAQRADLQFVGHIPVFVTPEEASAAGQATIEHSESLVEAYAFQLALDRLTNSGQGAEASIEEVFKASQKVLGEIFASFSDERANDLFRRFKENRTVYTPILFAYHEATQRRLSDEPVPDTRLRYLAVSAVRNWDQWFPWRRVPPEIPTKRLSAFARFLQLAALAARSGVPILAGSDHFPGSSLHDEIALLVDAGLTPLQALQAATVTPANLFGMKSDGGTIQEGRRADLVLLDANPLDDIRNTKSIHAVVLRGELFSRERLNGILADIQAAAASR